MKSVRINLDSEQILLDILYYYYVFDLEAFLIKHNFFFLNYINFLGYFNITNEDLSLIGLLFLFSLFLALLIFAVSLVIVFQNNYYEKNSAYECGFIPFGDARMNLNIRYYLVAILFLLFDLEVAVLFPWSIAIQSIGNIGFFNMMIFISMVTIGFVYEWQKGALDWT